MSADPVLNVVGLTKQFGTHAALDSVSFSVGANEIVALLGDNGAGKSTLVKCIAGIYTPDSGHIAVRGNQVDGGSPAHTRANGVGIVYQDLALFDNLSVAENLFAGSELRRPTWAGALGVVQRKAMLAEARATLNRLEVRVPNLKSPMGLLSGGQRQAIAVAKGIAFARNLVVLDEPTAALGLRERGNVLRLVKQLPATGISVMIISHNLEEVIEVADRAVVLRQGRFVGQCEATSDRHEEMVSMIVGGVARQAG
ncbi:D-xylose transport system ATP-binding protein [Marmoricola sp. URHA0025 HA25]